MNKLGKSRKTTVNLLNHKNLINLNKIIFSFPKRKASCSKAQEAAKNLKLICLTKVKVTIILQKQVKINNRIKILFKINKICLITHLPKTSSSLL